jgi:hypothetical protein
MDNHYKGLIWTNHALSRLRERGIKQGDAWATWNRPDQSYKGNLHKSDDAWRYYRKIGNEIIEVVAKQNERKEWLILSVWSREIDSKSSHGIPLSAHGATQLGSKSVKISFWRSLYNLIFKP